MWFVLIIILVVAAGWIYMASNSGRDAASRDQNRVSDGYVPVNAYDNPYDTDENNDRPFEPDACSDASDASSSGDSGSCDSSDSGSSSD